MSPGVCQALCKKLAETCDGGGRDVRRIVDISAIPGTNCGGFGHLTRQSVAFSQALSVMISVPASSSAP